MFSLPKQISCTTGLPGGVNNPNSGNPDDWLEPGGLAATGLTALTFDFFVNWHNKTVPDEIWLKTMLDIKQVRASRINTEDLETRFKNYVTNEHLARYAPFLDRTGLTLVHKLLPDSGDWSQPFQVGRNPARLYSLNGTVGEWHEREKVVANISQLRGGATTETPKGLNLAASTLECYLSRTKNLWPGDADAVLVDQHGEPKLILEYKKCTRPPEVREQGIDMWRRDVRKWQSLGLLRDKLGGGRPLPAIAVFYSTNDADNDVKLELLSGPYNDLSVRREHLVPRPVLAEPTTSTPYVDALIELLQYAQRNPEIDRTPHP